jgi:hypothetical protein
VLFRSLPSNLQVGADGTVVIPVNIDDAHPEGSTGLIRANLTLTYDPSVFRVSAADVHLGSVLTAGSGWSVYPTINPVTGQIAIALSSTSPINSTIGGSLVTIDFHQIGASGGSAPIALMASVNPTGQQVVSTELEDAQGAFTLTPTPTNGFNPRMDGMVMLVANSGALVGAPAPIAPGEVRAPVSSMLEALGTTASVTSASDETTTPNSPAVVPESSEQALIAGPSAIADTPPEHAFGVATAPGGATIRAATSALASIGAGTLTAPIAGVVIQFGNLPPLIAPFAGLGAGQHLADQVVQTLGTGTINPTLFATVKDVFEPALAGHLMLSPSGADNLDSRWDEVYSDLDWQGFALVGVRARRDVPADSAPQMVAQQTGADADTLDPYFAQMADDAEQGAGDE